MYANQPTIIEAWLDTIDKKITPRSLSPTRK